MGLFDKLRKNKETNKVSGIAEAIDKSNWLDVLSACLGKMMVIQNNAAKYVVKNRNWNVDFSKGYITFGDDRYTVQFIGSESNSSDTWMWGWNNINHFSESIIALSKETLSKGKKWDLEPLKTSQFDLNNIFNGHTLSIVACGLSDTDYFYYRGHHDAGAIFMAVGNAPKEVFSPVDISEFANITMQCIKQYPINHKIFVESFLKWNKTNFEWNSDNKELVAHFEQDLYIEFETNEEFSRIVGMKTRNNP